MMGGQKCRGVRSYGGTRLVAQLVLRDKVVLVEKSMKMRGEGRNVGGKRCGMKEKGPWNWSPV